MANPKRRHSQARRDIRRAQQRLIPPMLGTCPQCGTLRLPHRVCPQCGYYRGRAVLSIASSKDDQSSAR